MQKKARIVISRALYNVLQNEELTPWTEAEIKLSINNGKKFDSSRINRLFETNFDCNPEVYLWNYSQNFPLPLAPFTPLFLPSLAEPSMPSPTGPFMLPSTELSLPPSHTSSLPLSSLACLCLPIPLNPAPLVDIRLAPETLELSPATAITTSKQLAQSILVTTITTSDHGRALSNLTKMRTDKTNKAKYSNENDSHPHL